MGGKNQPAFVGSGCSLFFSLDLTSRRVLRLKRKKLRDAGDAPAAAEEVEEEEEGGKEDGEQTREGGGQMDADDCHVCPGTQAPPPSILSLTVGEVSAAHACLNRDAAEQGGRGQDAGRDGGGRCSAGECLPSVIHQHLRVSPDWLKSDQRSELTS